MQVRNSITDKGTVYYFDTTAPQTIYIHIPNPPRRFCVYKTSDNSDVENNEYYFRYLSPNMQFIKFNVPEKGEYFSYTPFEIQKAVGIETPTTWPVLPPPQRDRFKSTTIKINPLLKGGTPARIFSDTGVIEVSPDFSGLPIPVRIFLLEHEKAHMLYRDEEFCDLFAMVNFLRMGYNASNAYYSLTNYLKTSPENIERMKFLFSQIQKTQKQKL